MHLWYRWAGRPAVAGGSVHHVQAVSSRVTSSPPSRCRAARSPAPTTCFTTVPGTQKALSLPGKGPDLRKLVAGRDLNPRPLGYEPYDIGLCRLRQSLAGAVTSTDRTDPISLCRVRLLRLKLSRRVRFTIGLQNRLLICTFPHPPRPSVAAVPGARHCSRPRQATAKRRGLDTQRVASAHARHRAARRPVVITATGSALGHRRTTACPDTSPEPDCCRT